MKPSPTGSPHEERRFGRSNESALKTLPSSLQFPTAPRSLWIWHKRLFQNFLLGSLSTSADEVRCLHHALITPWDLGNEHDQTHVDDAYHGITGTIRWIKSLLAAQPNHTPRAFWRRTMSVVLTGLQPIRSPSVGPNTSTVAVAIFPWNF